MKNIDIFVDGGLAVVTAAATMAEAGKTIGYWKEHYRGRNIDVEIDGVEHTQPAFAVDVKQVAKNMKTTNVESKIMGDLSI